MPLERCRTGARSVSLSLTALFHDANASIFELWENANDLTESL